MSLGLIGWFAAGCAYDAPSVVVDQASYTAACEALLGTLPPLRCADGELVPVTVTRDGHAQVVTRLADLEDGFRCDRPSGLSGCVPGSRLVVSQTSRGVPVVLVCRQYDEHPGDADRYDQIGVIASDPASGATCFWSTPEDGLRRGDPVPRPGSPDDVGWGERSFWYTWEELKGNACVACHDHDAWVQDPWIQGFGVPAGRPDRYHVVAQAALGWTFPDDLVHPDAAPCASCHPLRRGSCELSMDATGRTTWTMPVSSAAMTWPASRWMDSYDPAVMAARYPSEAAWEAQWGAAADTIAACCTGTLVEGCWGDAAP